MKSKKLEYPEYFVVQTQGIPYVTMCCGWTKKQAREQASDKPEIWRRMYRMGARVKRVRITVL